MIIIGVVSATQNMVCFEIQVLKKEKIISISWKHLEEVGFVAKLNKFKLPIYFIWFLRLAQNA